MNDKENEHLDKFMFMVQMELNDGTSMQHITNVPIKVELDEKHSIINGNTRITISNPKTLMTTTTHEGVRKVVASNQHDVNCNNLFS
jgi:hypothetical protein